MKYQWIFFDADETLFSFDAFAGLRKLLAQYGVDFTAQDFAVFQQLNKPLWVKYQNAEISARELQIQRFTQLAERVQQDPVQLNEQYLIAMSDVCQPLEQVVETLQILRQQAKLAIITNGFTALQHLRLAKTGLADCFEFITISEDVGLTKPDVRIFEYSLQKAQVSADKVLMVGDSLETDILGGNRAGLDTCWLAYQRENNTDIQPTYQIQHFADLLNLV